jgi:DNA modification methylase
VTVQILTGDCREVLKTLPDESVHCVVTSPPYFGLRDYGCEGQLGLEPTPDGFVAAMVAVFREVRRALRADGTLWLNLGDSYASNPASGGSRSSGLNAKRADDGALHQDNKSQNITPTASYKRPEGLKPKDLIGIPWRVAFALQADGWYLRQDIIWAKPNPMPESVTDRCTKAHEYIFLLTKSARYYYDAEAIAEPVSESSIERWSQDIENQAGSDRVPGKTNGAMKAVGRKNVKPGAMMAAEPTEGESTFGFGSTRNKRSVWTVTTQPFGEAHFATFPPALIEPCILAGCPERCCLTCGAPWKRELSDRPPLTSDFSERDRFGTGDPGIHRKLGSAYTKQLRENPVVTTGWSSSCECHAETAPGVCLDPFGGAGTTGLVADRHHRNAILIELNPEYAAMAEKRIRGESPLFAQVTA